MRPETFKTETFKIGLDTKSQDFITANNPTKLSNKKVVKFIDLQRVLSFYGPTTFHGWPHAHHAWYKQFNSNAILPNINLM